MAEQPEDNRDQLAIQDVGPEVTQSSTENVMIVHQHQHHHHHDNRTVVQGNIYHGGEFKGDIMTSKTEVKDATIGAIGAPTTYPGHHNRHPLAIGAPESQLALPWPDPGHQSEDPNQGMVDLPALPWPETINPGYSAPTSDPGHQNQHPLAIGAPESQLALPWPDPGRQSEAPIQGMVDRPALPWHGRGSPGSTAPSSEPGDPRRHPLAIGGAESRPALPWPDLERHPQTSKTPRHQALPWPEGSMTGKDEHQRRSPANKGRDAALPWHDDLTHSEILEAAVSRASPPSDEDETHGEEPCGEEEEVEHPRGAESLSPGHHEGGHQTTPKDTGTSSTVGQQRRQGSGARPKQRTAAMQGTRPKDPSKYSTGSRESRRSSSREPVQRRGRSGPGSPPLVVGTGTGSRQTFERNDIGEEEDYREDIFNLSDEDSDEQSQAYLDSEVDNDIEGIISREKHRGMASTPIRRLRDAQTMTEMTVTYNTESQTTRKITRERMNQTETQQKFDTESQTDKAPTRGRMSQTESLLTVNSDTQTTQYHETKKSVRVNVATEMYTQTEQINVSEVDSQTNVTELSDTQTQTDVKTFDDNGFQTDEKEVSCGSMQTDVTPTSNVDSQTEYEESDLVFRVTSTKGNLIRMLRKEECEIEEAFKKKYKRLLPLISRARSTFLTELLIQICKDFGDRENQTVKALADLVLLNVQQTASQDSEWQDIKKFTSRANDVVEMGMDFALNKKYIHALISYYTAAKLYKLSNKGDESVRGIRACSNKTRRIAKDIAKQESMKEIIIGHVIVVMRKMIDFIRSIQNSTHTVRIIREAWCLYHIGLCYNYCGENQQYATENESAVKLLETEFKENAKNHQIYGRCLNNAGVAYWRMGNITKSIELHKRELDAYESANDWGSKEKKQTVTKRTEENLRLDKAKLEKQNLK